METTTWSQRIDQSRLTRRLTSLFDASGCPEDSEATLVLTDDEEVHALNKEYRDVDSPTDVLAFSMLEGEDAEFAGPLLGDVIISVETAERQAETQEHQRRLEEPEGAPWTLDDELAFLAIHGFLHLLGHDHYEPEEEAAMKAEEQRLWAIVREA